MLKYMKIDRCPKDEVGIYILTKINFYQTIFR